MCDCLQLTINHDTYGQAILQSDIIGQSGGYNYYEYTYGGQTFYIFWTGGRWFVNTTLGNPSGAFAAFSNTDDCPIASLGVTSGVNWLDGGVWTNLTEFTTELCPELNCWNEDRTAVSFNSIKLPETFTEENRGDKECCCKYMVLASDTGESWKNDVTSAWLKVSDPSDTFSFKLYKNNQVTSYTPTAVQFPLDEEAYYSTIEWADVLNSDGVGCYELKIEYSISGITSELSWGIYDLKKYTVQNASKTARIKAIFNGYQEMSGINFTGSDVVSTLRFYGYIGNRQPNTEIDNIMYSNREMKRVIRENLNTYEIITDPVEECITRPMIEIFLLSENELFISDYNVHNHSYRYQDLPVIVSNSPDVTYYELSRKASVSCEVSDKFKNKRTYYK